MEKFEEKVKRCANCRCAVEPWSFVCESCYKQEIANIDLEDEIYF